MDFWDLTRLVFRRWYVALPMVLASVAATMWTTATTKPDYKATAYVQLIPPSEASTTTNIAEMRNPWLDLGLGALDTAATYAVVDKTFLNELKQQGFSDNVTITNGYPAPIATIEVIAPSQQAASATADRVVQQFTTTVKALQDDYGVRPTALIVTRRLDTGKNLAQTGGKVKRALVAVAGAGLLLTCGLTIGFDALMRGRKRRPARKSTPEAATNQPEAAADQTVAITRTGFAWQRPGAPASAAGWLTGSDDDGGLGPYWSDGGDSKPSVDLPSNGQDHNGSSVRPQSATADQRPDAALPQVGSELTIVLPRVVADPPAGDGESTRR